MAKIDKSSLLPVDREDLWGAISTMAGVNAELGPLVRMTVPKWAVDLRFEDAPVGRPTFRSWLLLGGLVPVDRHCFQLTEVQPGFRFLETSSSWLHAIWQHERTLETTAGACRLTDRVTFESRITPLGTAIRPLVALVFAHRHRRLRSRYARRENHKPVQ